jgi:hypothetical protein
MQDNTPSPVFQRDNVWCDVFLRQMIIKKFEPGEIVNKEFEIPNYFYILYSGLL